MVAGLGDTRGLLRRTFAESLGAIGIPALPILREALINHSNVTVRRAAAKTLRLVGDPSALPDLLQALINDPDPVVQGSAVGAMAIFGEKAVDLLVQVLTNPQSTTLQAGLASWGLAFIGAEAPEALRKAAKSSHSAVRAAAIAALSEQIQFLGDEAAKRIVVSALKDSSNDVRAEAVTLIGKLEELNWAEPLLIEKLNDSNAEVRKNSALSLMTLKSIRSINSLKQLKSKEKDIEVLKVIDLALVQLGKIKQGI